MARKEDLKPIALTGELAGKEVDANGEGLTHELCRKWKLYCPECYQFVHLTSRREVPRYNCTQFSGGMKGGEIGGTEISKSF